MPLLYEDLLLNTSGLPITSVPKRYQLGQIIHEVIDTHVYDRYIPLKPGMTVIDIGSSIGVFSLYDSQKVGYKGKIVAVEPEPTCYKALLQNITSSKIKNIIPLNIALYNKQGKMQLHSNPNALICSSFFNEQNEVTNIVDVDVKRLDDTVRQLGINHVDFVKIDTEGAATEIIEGSEGILPYIDNFAVAAYHAPHENPEQIALFLQQHGFRTRITHHYGLIPYLYATRDLTINFPPIETWEIATIGGLIAALTGCYYLNKHKKA